VLVGLRSVTLLEVTRHHDERVEVVVESLEPDRQCGSCSTLGLVKERPRVALADLPVFGYESPGVVGFGGWGSTVR
jgi:hypothetical protein